jgi:hypothetical protein
MLLSLVGRGLSITEVYRMSVKQVIFLSKVNNRLRDLEMLTEMQGWIASNGRQMEDMGYTSFTNRLRYG